MRKVKKKRKISNKDDVEQYTHDDKKRTNNPPVGLVTAETDSLNGKKRYKFDPHLDPQLQWAGKTEGVSFDVDTISLHVHERIDPLTIIDAVKNKELREQQSLFHYFETPEENPPIREAIEFYKHAHGWSNRLIAGDSLLVMNSLLEKEGMAGKIQMIYIDPPYGIKYGSNFQPFVNKRDVKDGKDEDLTQEPEMIKAFRDTWELGIHSYLTYLRNRLLLARELLTESGSCFVQISDENLHHVKEIMDEIFRRENFVSIISFKTTVGQSSKFVASVSDYLVWYAKDKTKAKYHKLYRLRTATELNTAFSWLELPDGRIRRLDQDEMMRLKPIPLGKRFQTQGIVSQGSSTNTVPFIYQGKTYIPRNRHWTTSIDGLEEIGRKGRLFPVGNTLTYKKYADDFPLIELNNVWTDTTGSTFAPEKIYVVQTLTRVLQRCVLMTTDPGDLILDPTCGSGTTAYVAERWGRRWITCDTSRVSITLAKQRLMTSLFDYYELAHPKEGISSGFNYKKVPHITLGSIANNEPPIEETVYDQPNVDRSKKRVTGPFTVEAVPSQRVRSFEEVGQLKQEADMSIARSGETVKQNDWIDEMLATGIRGKGGQVLKFTRIESLGGTIWVHAEAETVDGQKAVISFGPEYAPLETRQVEKAIQESQELVPKPKIVIFASFQFDPEAAKDIDELKWPGVNILKVQMNTDLFTSDLKKNRASNEAFWLVGQPDIEIKKQGEKYVVIVNGFDYYNTKTGEIESGDISKIAMWELDTDYDGRSLYPRQVFLPMAGSNEGWSKLTNNLKSHIDGDLIKKYIGNVSLPFKLSKNKQIAIKIIDDRGIESLKIIKVKE
ncbi:MAG: site-specific DNA-methyltransferase [Candidatus Aenigmarchaeota archaeon]|nr:site-specific DNA-methyltransferase [Candidatus Aenigmarchaeota archaeon]